MTADENDIEGRLRQQSWCGPLHTEAADAIKRLRTENKRLRMLLMEGRSVHGGWPDVAEQGEP